MTKTFKYTPNKKGSRHRFYNIDVSGSELIVNYGRAGTSGRSLSRTFPTHEAAKEEMMNRIIKRMADGYHYYQRGKRTSYPIEAQKKKFAESKKAKEEKKKSAKITKSRKTKSTGAFTTSTSKKPRKPSTFGFNSGNGTLEQWKQGIHHYPSALESGSIDPQVEIVFSFDTTGSMSCYLDQVRKNLAEMVRQLLQDIPNIRIGIIAHGDFCDHATYVIKALDLSNKTDTLVEFVDNVESTFGGDGDECYELVLREAQKLSWSPHSTKALVMIGDNEPHSPDSYMKINWRDELKELKQHEIKVHGVQAGNHSACREFLETLAKETSGETFRLDNIEAITEMVMGLCYREATEMQGGLGLYDAEFDGDINVLVESRAEGTSDGDDNDSDAIPMALDDDDTLLSIHRAIHDPSATRVTVEGETYDLSVGGAGCRTVRLMETTFIEQNKNKHSRFAKMAMEGHKITWFVRKGKWGLIVDDRVSRRLC